MLRLLTSPQEVAETTRGEEYRNMKTGGRQGSHGDRNLFRWAEYHREQFQQRLAEQNLGPFTLSIIAGKSLQEGSMTQEYQNFLKAPGPAITRSPALEKNPLSHMRSWLAILGNGCSLLLVGWLGCQLWYNGSRIIMSLEHHVSLDTFLRAICCGIMTFVLKPTYAPGVEIQEDQERLQEQDIDLINMGPAWKRAGPEAHVAAGPVTTNTRKGNQQTAQWTKTFQAE